jgi:small subunit ribosomal protein S8
MSHIDPIADMLTRIRNAVRVERDEVLVQASRVCEGIAKVLLEQGYINGYDRVPTSNHQDVLRIRLKYGPLGEKVIRSINRCSKPSRRVYCPVDKLPKIMGGLGINIVSTSQGVLADNQCVQRNLGGELLCCVS